MITFSALSLQSGEECRFYQEPILELVFRGGK